MPTYDYYCEANGRTVEVLHNASTVLKNWGELCYVARIPFGDTPVESPVKKLITGVHVHVSPSNAELKNLGFTKLVRRDEGVYENVTAVDGEKRYFKGDDPSSAPHLHKKIGD